MMSPMLKTETDTGVPRPVSSSRRKVHLSDRLDRLETQIGRLTDLLAEQAATRKRQRKQFTIRFMLLSFTVFAILFAWFGNVFHHSRLQAHAVDRLVQQGAFVMYAPRQSTLVGLLPGDPKQPPACLVHWLGDDFFRAVTNVSTRSSKNSRDKQLILSSLASLDQLQKLRLARLQLKSADLLVLNGLSELQSVDISRTGLDQGTLPWAPRTNLRWFDASHTRLSDRALADLSLCDQLQQLRLERTAVTDNGLRYLENMSQLRYLNLKRCPVSAGGVRRLANKLPGCMIEWEPLRFLPNGKVDIRAARAGRVQYGGLAPPDPRASRRVGPPLDSSPQGYPVQVWGARGAQAYPGMTLDVF